MQVVQLNCYHTLAVVKACSCLYRCFKKKYPAMMLMRTGQSRELYILPHIYVGMLMQLMCTSVMVYCSDVTTVMLTET